MNIFALAPRVIDIFRVGGSVVDNAKGKNWGALGGSLGVLIYAIAQAAKALGYELPIDNATAERIGVGIASIAGVFVTYGTSAKVGLPGLAPMAGAGGGQPASEQGPLAAQAGSVEADAGVSNQVRPSGDPSNPSSGYLPG